jgi:hypothetical protein
MSEQKQEQPQVAIDEKIEKLEAAVDPNTVISIGGYSFTPAKLMIVGAIISSVLGGLYGAFEIYKDYQDMKEAIQTYVAPDLSEINKKIEVLDANTSKTVEYSQDIKNDLKNDIRRLETLLENIERRNSVAIREMDTTVKQTQRDVDGTLKEVRRYSDQTIKEINREVTQNQKETAVEIRALRKEIDDKIKKALDNPLADK